MFGDIIARLLTPFLGFLQVVMSVAYVIQTALMVPLQMLGGAFSWFYDDVIVKVGNWIIDMMNAVIDALNHIPFVDIKNLDSLKTTGELIKEFNEGLKKELTDSEKAFVKTFEAMADKLNEMVDKQIQSLQDLYEVGALSGAEYEARSKALDSQKIKIDEAQLLVAIEQYDSIEKLRGWIEKNVGEYMKLKEIEKNPVGEGGSVSGYIPEGPGESVEIGGVTITNLNKSDFEKSLKDLEKWSAGLPFGVGGLGIHLASGTDRIPYDNFLANLHKDEGVIPGDFMSAINSGELVLSGGKGGAGSTVNNYYSINVEGTVVTENELIEKVHKKTGTMMRRGYVS
jgi:hypothetical protein